MDRISGANFVDIGSGRRGFRSENRVAGVIGTEVTDTFMNGVQEEILSVIESEGITPLPDNWAQLLAAIEAKIERARVNQPVYPEVLTADAKFTITSPAAGQIQIGPGTQWVMRGGKTQTSILTTLLTSASKIYHLRWREDTGFVLYDLASLTYNPTALSEDNKAFDTAYDDMLVARITTNAANVATIVALINRANLTRQVERRDVIASALDWVTLAGSATTLNWSRTPQVVFFAMNEWRSNNAGPDGNPTVTNAGIARAVGGRVPTAGRTRYQIPALEYYYEDDQLNHGTASWQLLIQAFSGGGV